MRTRSVVIAALVPCAAWLVACTGGTATAAVDECSTGPTYTRDRQDFVVENDPNQYAACVPHCGYTGDGHGGPGVGYYADALPSGACSHAGATCGMDIAITCCGETTRGPVGGPVHGMRCRCEAGQWRCVIAQPGGGGCQCGSGDAGADASRDASVP